jgi:hypothetical protein
MFIATHSAGRHDDTSKSQTSQLGPSAAVRGRHRGGRSGPAQYGTAALLRRAASAAAVWSMAFGLVSLAEGWAELGLSALVAGALTVAGVAASCALSTDKTFRDDPHHPPMPGLKRPWNGYGQ